MGKSLSKLACRRTILPAAAHRTKRRSGKEVALRVSSKIAWENVFDGPFVDVSGANKSGCDQVAEPRCCKWVDFVVVRTQGDRALYVVCMSISVVDQHTLATWT